MSAITEVCSLEYSAAQIAGWTSGKRPDGYVSAIATSDFFVAQVADRIVGFSEFNPTAHELAAVYVHPEFLRQGIGSTLLRAAEQAAHSRAASRIDLRATLNAVSFYRSAGYRLERFETIKLSSGTMLPCAAMSKIIT